MTGFVVQGPGSQLFSVFLDKDGAGEALPSAESTAGCPDFGAAAGPSGEYAKAASSTAEADVRALYGLARTADQWGGEDAHARADGRIPAVRRRRRETAEEPRAPGAQNRQLGA